ncbi:MAG TPA: outer membrane beta-barrel protein [Gemmatimonadaceae bacterium]|jgi:opacity protein-like surface antigen
MLHTRSLARLAMVAASLALIVGTPHDSRGQVPTKPLPRDSVAKPKQAGVTKRIPIRKEHVSAGEVVPMPRDTVIQTILTTDPQRDDSIRAFQHNLDSIAESFERARLRSEMLWREADAAARVHSQWTAAREADSIALQRSLMRGFYIGIGGGATAPQRALRNGYIDGYNVTVPVGYDATHWLFGVRLDGSVDHMNGTRLHNVTETLPQSGDITVWSLNTDLKLRIPLPKANTRTHFYTLAGIGVHKVTGSVYGTSGPNAGENLNFDKTGAKFGWNVGAGAAIPWGPAEFFIESRFMQVKSDMAYHLSDGVGKYTSFTPVLIGLQWF